jgi:hypothetical protein
LITRFNTNSSAASFTREPGDNEREKEKEGLNTDFQKEDSSVKGEEWTMNIYRTPPILQGERHGNPPQNPSSLRGKTVEIPQNLHPMEPSGIITHTPT